MRPQAVDRDGNGFLSTRLTPAHTLTGVVPLFRIRVLPLHVLPLFFLLCYSLPFLPTLALVSAMGYACNALVQRTMLQLLAQQAQRTHTSHLILLT